MKSSVWLWWLFCASLLLLTPATRAAFSDNAAAYDSWTDNSTHGTGFNPWHLYTTNTDSKQNAYAGYYIGDSSVAGGSSTNINSDGKAFAMYANGATSNGTAFSNAERNLASPLATSSSFSMDLAFGYVGDSGNRGVDIFKSGGGQLFNLNAHSGSYSIQNVSSGSTTFAASQNQKFRLVFSQTSGLGGDWQVYNLNTSTSAASGNYSGILSGLHLYIGGAGSQAGDNFYANNFSSPDNSTPEATSPLLFGSGMLSLLGARRRKLAT